jgi:hypothetical protein
LRELGRGRRYRTAIGRTLKIGVPDDVLGSMTAPANNGWHFVKMPRGLEAGAVVAERFFEGGPERFLRGSSIALFEGRVSAGAEAMPENCPEPVWGQHARRGQTINDNLHGQAAPARVRARAHSQGWECSDIEALQIDIPHAWRADDASLSESESEPTSAWARGGRSLTSEGGAR